MQFTSEDLKQLHIPKVDSHKGQNGKLLLIGGSHLFHAASLWALDIASKIVDMVFYSSVPENNQIVQEAKQEFRNGIVIPREKIDDYANEADCILIGPGMVRSQNVISNIKYQMSNIQEINTLQDEGEQTYWLTKYLLDTYPQKKWVIDAGALQMMEPEWLLPLQGNVVITPHPKEFETLFRDKQKAISDMKKNKSDYELIAYYLSLISKEYNSIILLKGQTDIVCSPTECVCITGGNAGMTKGGTGDVLAGLVAALACTNDLFLSACAGSYINKKAGESLFQKVGYYFNSSDLANEIPYVMKELF
jgi:NAD(P)H-hydrate epimerase